MEPVRVGYSRVWGWGLMIAGAAIFSMHLYLISLTGKIQMLSLVVNIFLVFSGALYLIRPYFELQQDRIVVYALIGPVRKQYVFRSMSDIVFEGDKTYLVSEGKRRRIWIGRLMSDKEQWKIFEMTVRNSDLTGELHDI